MHVLIYDFKIDMEGTLTFSKEELDKILAQKKQLDEAREKIIKQCKDEQTIVETEMQARLAEIRKKYEPILKPIYEQLVGLDKCIEATLFAMAEDPESLKFDGYEKTKVSMLKLMTHSQIEFLVWLKSGKKHCFRYRQGDGVSYDRTMDERRSVGIRYLQDSSCSYCKEVMHSKETCPKLASKKCSACDKQGHSVSHCKEKVGTIYRKKQFKF